MDDYEFALCLTHDVDRPYKTYQGPFYAVTEFDLSHLRSLFTDESPYWQFESIMELEDDLGVRSSFYFLNEKRLFRDKPPWEWVKPESWKLYTGRYDVTDDEIASVVRTLDRGGWEVGLHGSYDSVGDVDRLRHEKRTLERIVGDDVVGGRQHYLNLDGRETWRHHRAIGLRYDASLGSSQEYGFQHGYGVRYPFDDEFAVFPLTIMETALMESTPSVDAAWRECRRLLTEARENGAVMTVLWHPRYMNEAEFSGYRTIYERLVREALSMDAWVGPVAACYDRLESDRQQVRT